MPHEAPPIPPTLDREQTLKDISTLEEKLAEAKQFRNELAQAIEGKDEPKQTELTKKIGEILSQCRSLKRKIEGVTTTIEVDYVYTKETKDEKTDEVKKEEKTEKITLNIDNELESFSSFYTKHTIEMPPDFKETILDIWNRNRDQIEELIREKGFNTILLIPPLLPNLTDLNTKMSEGYSETYKGVKLEEIREKPTGLRIVLIHDNQELNELLILKETLGKTATSLSTETMTLSDYLILQRKIFEETGKHLDTNLSTWLPGSTVPNPGGGSRVVYAHWNPDDSRLSIHAYGAGPSDSHLGCRLSRSFF